MKQVIFAGFLAAALATGSAPALAQTASKPATSLGSVTINHKVMADGQALPTGTYQIRLTSDEPKPAVGQSPESERFVEFVRGGKVVAREVATVMSNADVATIVKGPKPATGGVRVDVLKGNDYVRVWINRGGQNYLIHLPAQA
ncbi:MAG: hypothetical protein GEU82_04335 [Luteitalea sp.]|nr:hypothetical protein [Luteitalea sp.]